MKPSRQLILHCALSYMLSNLDDVNEAFSDDEEQGVIVVDGVLNEPFTEAEVEAAMFDPFETLDADNGEYESGKWCIFATCNGWGAFQTVNGVIIQKDTEEEAIQIVAKLQSHLVEYKPVLAD